MNQITPTYALYFDLNGITSYDESEFNTIKKIIANIINNRYYQLEIEIEFNEEILNYEVMKKRLSNNIMRISGQISDFLVDDLIEEVKNVLSIDNVIRNRTTSGFNSTGYSDEELMSKYNYYLRQAQLILKKENIEIDRFKKGFIYDNLGELEEKEFDRFCTLLIENINNIEVFEFLYDLKVVEALFLNFDYFLKFIELIDFKILIIYYNRDLIKILRNIRIYVKQSDDFNDNIKELFIYKYILNNKLSIDGHVYDPEEGFNKIREEIESRINKRNKHLVNSFDEHVNLFKNDYHIISVGDSETKAFKNAKEIADKIKRKVEVIDRLLKAFRMAENTTVHFNCKFNDLELYRDFLDNLKSKRIIDDYKEKYGDFTISIENSDHMAFLQGKWFEYYTASICEEIIINSIKDDDDSEYGIYQNVVVRMNGFVRELDIVVCINDLIYYIENKIERKNTFASDLEKYRVNSQNMNIDNSNCYLVYLNGEDSSIEDVRVLNIKNFINQFKKGVIQNLEKHKLIKNAKEIEEQKVLKHQQTVNKIIRREKARLQDLSFKYDIEQKRIDKAITEQDDRIAKVDIPNMVNFFSEAKIEIEEIGELGLIDKFVGFEKKYQKDYLHKISLKRLDRSFFKAMNDDLIRIDNNKLKQSHAKLLCLANDWKKAIEYSLPVKTLLLTLCGYGKKINDYYNLILFILKEWIHYTKNDCDAIFIHYLDLIDESVIIRNIDAHELVSRIVMYHNVVNETIERGNTHVNNPVLARRKELKFMNTFLLYFMKRHFDGFEIRGLSLTDFASFVNTLQNLGFPLKDNLKQSKIGSTLNKFKPTPLTFMRNEDLDPASYLYSNYHSFSSLIERFRTNVDKGYVFDIPKSEQNLKLMKLLLGNEIIVDYKDVKNTERIVGVFSNEKTYNWLVDFRWVGIYLPFKFDVDGFYSNIAFENQNIDFRSNLIIELNDNVLFSLGIIINGELLSYIDICPVKDFESILLNLNETKFDTKITEIINKIENLIEENK